MTMSSSVNAQQIVPLFAELIDRSLKKIISLFEDQLISVFVNNSSTPSLVVKKLTNTSKGKLDRGLTMVPMDVLLM